MKKKFFMGAGAVFILSAGVFAGSQLRFSAASDIYVKKNGTTCVRVAAVANPVNVKLNDMSSGAGAIATMTDESGIAHPLYENSTCTVALYFNP